MKFRKNSRLVFFISSSLAFLLSGIILGKILQKDFSPDDSLNILQNEIEQKDLAIIDELDQLNAGFQHSPDSTFFRSNYYSELFQEKGMVFFVKENDSLLYWSDNSVPVDFLFKDSIPPVINSGNAFFRLLTETKGQLTFYGLYLLKNQYPYENDFLSNDFHHSFKISCDAKISTLPLEFNIHDRKNQFLFSIQFHPLAELTIDQTFLILFFYLFAILFFLGVIYEAHLKLYRFNGLRFLFVGGFIIDVILVRILLYFFRQPDSLYNSNLFSPKFYAYSDFIPSLGDLFLHVVFLLVISFFLFSQLKFNTRNLKRNRFYKQFTIFTLFMHVFIFFKGITFLFQSLVIDSNISLDLNNIFSLTGLSLFSFLILACFILSYFLVTSKLVYFAYKYSNNMATYFTWALLAFIVFNIICLQYQNCHQIYLSAVFGYIFSFWFFFKYKYFKPSLSNIVFYILFFSVVSTYMLHQNNDKKEREYRKMIAGKLSSEQRDPLAEYLFSEIYNIAQNDSVLNAYLQNYLNENIAQDSLNKYMRAKYFSGYWEKFDLQLTICTPDDDLLIQPENLEINCFDYFNQIITTEGTSTDFKNLFVINYTLAENGYLSTFSYDVPFKNTLAPVSIYVELTPQNYVRNLGFPDLLVNEKVDASPDLAEYSYAKYISRKLYKRVGKYPYNISLSHYGNFEGQHVFFDRNGYNHLYNKIDDNKDIIISKRQKTIMDILAPFSYLFLSYGLFILLIYFIFILPVSHRNINLNFRTRLQISISSIILFSFIVIGVFTLFYINNLNEQKNRDILSEKTHSVLVELQHKFLGDDELFSFPIQLENLLVKFSNVFFTDINLYDLDGTLISSSRSQIFDEKLIGRKMNPVAFYELTINNNSLFIHNERIGQQDYLSAYIPFINNEGRVVALLNLPYFAKENDLKREISSFLVAYINIYVILIALSILIALVISNYVARPIKLIVSKIKEVKLLGQNEKIIWKKKDEIGKLVTEYNRMIDALAHSAELLARSERESAWREMAKQVAHEIKNPLTPMKLSVQYLERTWKDKSPDWDKRLSKFTQTMIEQIDTLSAIASEFSDFAKMPLSKKENINIEEVVQSTISLFKNYGNIKIKFTKDSFGEFTVYADKEQLLRAFNNLLKNSIQAIGDNLDGKINISIHSRNQNCEIGITDNGGGIPDELKDKIFSPNFTTKSGGMGLGLAIVKSVIVNSGGDISFNSIEHDGTTFIIKLPLV
jgi:signal transduction histidine kinase